MKQYTLNTKCPKCGDYHAKTRYETKGEKRGLLRRTCERCNYVWHEMPLDKQECA